MSSCTFTHHTLERLQDHIQIQHNNNQKISIEVILFPAIVTTVNTSESSEQDDAGNLASGEEFTTDASSSFSLGPIRGRQPHLSLRPTPYQRTDEDSQEVHPLSAGPPSDRSPHFKSPPTFLLPLDLLLSKIWLFQEPILHLLLWTMK